jgi:hypothetical protein
MPQAPQHNYLRQAQKLGRCHLEECIKVANHTAPYQDLEALNPYTDDLGHFVLYRREILRRMRTLTERLAIHFDNEIGHRIRKEHWQ